MFCYQCEQTAKGTGCTVQGVCGKDSKTASLQDLLLYGLKGMSIYADGAGKLGFMDNEVDLFTVEALFTTITNVNFDPERLEEMIEKLEAMTERAKDMYFEACKKNNINPENISFKEIKPGNLEDLVHQGEAITIMNRINSLGSDITALQELLTYGLKGMAAYADHAKILGKEDKDVFRFFHEALNFLNKTDVSVDDLVEMCLKCGKYNLKVMEILDSANTGAYGNPKPVPIRITPLKGKAILVSGHDLKDLEELLKQTEGKGINVYTHGEMLPAHGYPELKKYNHLVGNYGGAWQDQREEFDKFPGSILMTTNCIQRPKDSYVDRIFTSGLVAFPGVRHIKDRNFAPLIDAAMNAEGFKEDGEDRSVLAGFGHNAVMNVADKVVEAVKNGKIRRFFLIGGCDGAKSGRNYYTEFAQSVPEDCVILTLACGKYRFNKLPFGDIDGIPRLLDVGQCNDAYSAIQIALELAGAFDCGVNDLPLSFILSWYEQKAVAILLTLLHLGIKNIRLGPSLPAFVTPAVLDILVKNFNIMPITTVQEDLNAILGTKTL